MPVRCLEEFLVLIFGVTSAFGRIQMALAALIWRAVSLPILSMIGCAMWSE